MNAGAALAIGDVLLFLHADTRPPQDFDIHVREVLARPGVSAGAFRLGIDAPGGRLRFIEAVANIRSRFLGMPYGDQALFMAAEVFAAIGGYPDQPIMEDFELVRRLQRRGGIAIAPKAVATSPRRWLNVGVSKTWLINQSIVVAYLIGISPVRLAEWYRREKGRHSPGVGTGMNK
jgi:rSAM/selenodomain-associated transferase 2